MTKTLMVMAGGTGGHIFPALAVADVLRAKNWRIVWLGNPTGMEAKLVPAHGYECAWVPFGGLRGKGLRRKLMLPVMLWRACLAARTAMRQVRPDVVLGMGGYVTFPGGVMARLARLPLVIHEQNAIAGLANKALAKIATRVLTGFPRTLPDGQWVGNPVRCEITALPDPVVRYGQRVGMPNRVLVMGGSLGAQALNQKVPVAVAAIPVGARPEVWHQTGAREVEAVRAAYANANIPANVQPFIEDVAAALAWADLVICRAGALTVAELAAAGVASMLVPYPYAVDDHQRVNAEFLVKNDAGQCEIQNTLTTARLVAVLSQSRHQLQQQAIAARALAMPKAAETVAAICEDVAL